MEVKKGERIDVLLKEMHQSAELQQYDLVEAKYKQALEAAQVLVGEEAPLLLLMMCMARWYEAQDQNIHAECFNRKVRHMIMGLPKDREQEASSKTISGLL